MPLINPTRFYQPRGAFDPAGGGGGAAPTIFAREIQTADGGFGPSQSFTVDFGTADATRVIVVCAYNQPNFTVSSVTIGGSGGTKAIEQSQTNPHSSIWYRAVAAGTSGQNVTLNASALGACGIAVYALYNVTAAPTDTQMLNDTATADPQALPSLTVPALGFGIAMLVSPDTADRRPAVWTGTSSSSSDLEAFNGGIGNGINFVTAHSTTTGIITASGTTGSGFGFNNAGMAAAAWGP